MTPAPADAARTVLLVDPAGPNGFDLASQLDPEATGLSLRTATDIDAVRSTLRGAFVDCAVCAHDPPTIDGVEVLSAIHELRPELPVLVAVDPDQTTAVIDAGAADVVQAPDGVIDRRIVTNRIENLVSGTQQPGRFERVFQQANDGIAIHDPETDDMLEANRDRLTRILERVDDGFVALDDEWRVTYANEEGAAVLRGVMGVNYGLGGLVGRHLWEEAPQAVDTPFYDHCHEAMATQEPVAFEAHFAPLERWFDINAYPDEDGISVYFQDITTRKRRERVLDALLETTQEFMQVRDETELAGLVVDATAEILGYDSNIVRLHDEETDTLPPTMLSQTGAERLPDPPMYTADEGIVGRVFQSGEPLVVDDLTTETDREYGPFRSAVVLPLGDHGTLGIGSEEPDSFDDEDVALAELLATTARVALDRIERETELRRFRRVIEQVEEMVFLLDSDGTFTFVTEPFAAFLGYDRDRLEGRQLDDVLALSARETYADRRADLVAGNGERTVAFETTVVTATAEEHPVELTLSTFPADVSETGIVGTVTDIRELTETRARLEAERDRFRHLFENLPDPVVEVELRDGEPTVQRVKSTFETVFGHDGTSIRGQSLTELIVPSDDAAGLDTHIAAGERVSAEAQRETADGRRDFLVRGIPYR
ncbi:MAG: PAS domain S-box protein [Haloplanus sp.]